MKNHTITTIYNGLFIRFAANYMHSDINCLQLYVDVLSLM